MEKTVLGKTGLTVTKLGYGALELGGLTHMRPITDLEAERAANAVLDAGITFIDTAVCYGLSEHYIGKYISHRRSEYVLATKCGCVPCAPGESYHGGRHVWTKATVLGNIDQSLRLLKTDYVDVLQLHTPTVTEVVENGLLDAVQSIKDSGKARFIGISSTVPDIEEFLRWDVFSTFQIPYSAFERAHENVITTVAQAGAGTIIRGGLSSGEPGVGTGGRNERLRTMWTLWNRAKLDELLGEGESKTAFMLRFTLSHPDISTIIVGSKNPDHIRDNVRVAGKGPLAPDVLAEVKRRLDAAGESPLP